MAGEPVRPESMLGATTKKVLIEVIDRELEKSIREGNTAQASELQRAKKLINKGCWSIRAYNPFIGYMEECLLGQKGDLKTTQEAMKHCSEKWSELSDAEKLKYKTQKNDVYDYL